MEGHSRSLFLLVVAAGLLFFARLDLPLLEPQEARYAEIPRQMLRDGSWLTPVLHGQPYLDKPPLLYWLVMASYSVFGVHDWVARLVPGCCGLLTILVVYLWGRRLGGERVGLAGALVLCLSARYVYLGRMLTFDTLLCLWVTAALATADVRRRGLWLLSAVCCGLGVLTKGPVALVLVVVPVVLLDILDRESRRLSWRAGLEYLAVVALVAGPWFVVMARTQPDFLYTFFWRHHVVRFVEPFDHAEPLWFYLPGLLLGMLPWTLFARPALAPRVLGLPLLAAVWGLVFFSLSGCKRPVYILPVLPPLALVLGVQLAALSDTLRRRCVLATFAILFIALMVGAPWYHERFALRSCVQSCEADVNIACYPRSFDSVSFYLGRADVRGFGVEQRDQLLHHLAQSRRTLLFVRLGKTADSLLAALPPELEFKPLRQSFTVLVGEITSRPGPARSPLRPDLSSAVPRDRCRRPGRDCASPSRWSALPRDSDRAAVR